MYTQGKAELLEQHARQLDDEATRLASQGCATQAIVKREQAAALRVQANEARRQTRAAGVRFG